MPWVILFEIVDWELTFFQHGEVVMFNYYQFLQQQAATLPSGTLPTGFNVIPGVTGPGNC